MIAVDEKYMQRCIQLAQLGKGFTAPNPMVGAVIVGADGKILGEGYHRKCGEPHAEVNAIASVGNQSSLKDATLYVSLEPCSHYGKTPPCAELIIRMGISRVVIGCLDPFVEVSGRGVRMLREAGVEVVIGVMEAESYKLNKAFMTMQQKARPYILLKWAQSADGYVDKIRTSSEERPIVLSSDETRRVLHRMRSQYEAILVGPETAILDNPSLSVRSWSGKNPVRVLVDRNLRVPITNHLFDGSVKTIVMTEKKQFPFLPNVEYVTIDMTHSSLPRQVCAVLNERKLNSLIVEGGPTLLNLFLKHSVWDEMRIEYSPIIVGNGISAPELKSTYKRVQVSKEVYQNGHFVRVFKNIEANL